ncbi:MAG: hypothetical protein OXG53_16145 [Chloroflexi bacterium]|nr:hypothetical protein [Chloroflexota bacterium]
MEAQEVRIVRLEELTAVTADSQTETLRILQEQSKRLDAVVERLDEQGLTLQEHTKILQEHTKILQEHTKILQEHSRTLLDHSKRLDNLENLMTRVLEELIAIKEILASSRGMGFALEPKDSD